MQDEIRALEGKEIMDNARAMAGRMHFDNVHDREDAEQEAALAMWVAALRQDESKGEVQRFQRKSGKGAVLDFYNANKKRRAHLHLTLTKMVDGENGAEFIDLVPEEAGASHAERQAATERDSAMQALVASLPPSEAVVIDLRFFQGKTLVESGAELGCSAEYVRQVESKALESLRHRWEQAQK